MAAFDSSRFCAQQLERAAHDLRLIGSISHREGAGPFVASPAADLTADFPALTAPLTLPVPSADQWILIGSLMEDLRRVREEIIGTEEL